MSDGWNDLNSIEREDLEERFSVSFSNSIISRVEPIIREILISYIESDSVDAVAREISAEIRSALTRKGEGVGKMMINVLGSYGWEVFSPARVGKIREVCEEIASIREILLRMRSGV